MPQTPRLVTTGANAVLLWQTTTGVSPDTAIGNNSNAGNGIYRAQPPNDPLPIIIQNQDGNNSVTLGGSGVTAGGNGTILLAGASITRNVVGNDSEWVIANAGTPTVSVEPGRQ